MTLRRYSALKSSKGTVIPTEMREAVMRRDQGCIGLWVGFPGECVGGLEADHVRASHGMGMKSETSLSNLVAMCSGHHRYKTEHGREVRPRLLNYLDWIYNNVECSHVEPVHGCRSCYRRSQVPA